MKKTLRFWLWFLVLLVVMAPASFIATFLLHPLWSWLEAASGIESIGHSAPAEWCFWAVYGLSILVSCPFLRFFCLRP